MREQLSLEQFEVKKNIMQQLNEEQFNYFWEHFDDDDFDREEHSRQSDEQYIILQNDLLSYDLSAIPFKAWEDLKIISNEHHLTDFSMTHANIDFDLLKLEGDNFNFKGCQIKNLEHLSTIFIAPNMFDEEIRKRNPQLFLSDSFSLSFQDKYYSRELSLEDLLYLSESQIDELILKKVERHIMNIYFRISEFKNIFSFDKIIELYRYYKDELFSINSLLRYASSYISKFDFQEISIDSLYLELKNTSIESIKDVVYRYVRQEILLSTSPVEINQLPQQFIKENPDIFIDDKSASDEFKRLYYSKNLSIDSLLGNMKYLEGHLYEYFIRDTRCWNLFQYIGSEGFHELFEKYLEILIFYSITGKLDSCLWAIDSKEHWEEEFKEYINNDSNSILAFFGIEFWNHLFSSYGYYLITFLKMFSSNFFVRDHQCYDTITKKSIDKYDFEKLIQDFIVKKIYAGEFSYTLESAPSFLCKTNPELFLEDAPQELCDKFYSSSLTLDDFANDPNLLSYFSHTNVIFGFQIEFHFLSMLFSDESLLDGNKKRLHILTVYSSIQNNFIQNEVKKYILYNLQKAIDEYGFEKLIQDFIVKKIYAGEFSYTLENSPSFLRKTNPELFLEDAPQELCDKFYSSSLTLDDFAKDPDLLSYFSHTNIIFGFPIEFHFLSMLFSNENLLDGNKKRLQVLMEYSYVKDAAIQNEIKKFMLDNLQNISVEIVHNLILLTKRICNSNSSEIIHVRVSLIDQLLHSSEPLRDLTQIEDVYLKNYLPEVAKLFIVFQILYTKEIFNNTLSSESSPNLLSKSYRGCQTILFSDLLKCSLASNNRSMKKYIYNIEEGQKILEQVTNDTNMSTLDKEQQELLSTYFMNLNALYNNTQKGKLYSNELSGNIEKDLLGLIKLFLKTEDIHKLPDQIVKMYGHFAGFDTLKDLKEYMKTSVEKADKKNRERAQKNHFAISKGDFIKGLGLNNDKYYFLKNILQNGSVCKEFLGSAASSDTTPFDTDVSKITEDNPSFEVFSSRYVASLYGPLWIVLKNDERFHETSENDNSYDPNKLEVFLTGGGDHYGIRTGFPSSAIDFFVVDESQIKLDRIKYEIVMNGFYIPVVSTEEKLLFTPDEYDRLHQEMMGLSYYGTESEYVFAKELEHFTLTEEQRIAQVNTQEEVLDYRREFVETLKKAGLPIVTERDPDLSSPVLELLDTGSTGRGTNKVSDYDFDFIMRVNGDIMMDNYKKQELFKKIQIAFPNIVVDANAIRDTIITLPSGKKMKIDITFIVKTDKLSYSTDECIKDRLRTIRNMSEEMYQKVLANIVMAKEVLKDVYKPRHAGKNPQGGLGGVGIENWILQNGGSFEHAAREFIRISENKPFADFIKEYAVWDFGENHLSFRKQDEYMHDSFVRDNMTEEGYHKMQEVLKEYLRSLERTQEFTMDHAMHL